MALADREKRELDEIEQRLAEDDPKFAARFSRPGRLASLTRRTLRVLGVFVAYLTGLLAMMAGVTWSSAPLIVLGAGLCASVFAGLVAWAWRAGRPS